NDKAASLLAITVPLVCTKFARATSEVITANFH
ncbi:hypothetical protein Gpo141_00002313, partial [Globisporangium polare]